MFSIICLLQRDREGVGLTLVCAFFTILNVKIHLLVESVVPNFYGALVILDSCACLLLICLIKDITSKLFWIPVVYVCSILLNLYMVGFQVHKGDFLHDYYYSVNIALFETLLMLLAGNSRIKELLLMYKETYSYYLYGKSKDQFLYWYVYSTC